ncbi:MAG: AAA-like domain-containing protein [Methylococcaceae bacterium]
MKSKFEYQIGGSLHFDSPSYVERQADTELYQALKEGQLCYVFNCRQMGKSSLLVRMKYRLQQEGFKCATVDLSILGTELVTPIQWYKGLIGDLWSSFKGFENRNLNVWSREREEISFSKRLSEFFEELLFIRFPNSSLVIFIDEIDSILGLDFSVDDFFVLIRFCYNQRAINPEYQRLNFALFGVVEPGNLIKDKSQTPFNIGRAIDLTGFSLKQAEPLEKGLERNFKQPKTILKQILTWTGGQPFLTQKLCDLVVKSSLDNSDGTFFVEELINKTLINGWETQDQPEHFRTIRDRLFRIRKRVGRMLSLYQKVLIRQLAINNPPIQIPCG